MPQEANPRGTFEEIAELLKGQIEANPKMEELPSAAEVMRDHDVSRGVVLRAFTVLKGEGAAEPVPGGRWRVIRDGQRSARRPLVERLLEVITDDKVKLGATFPSASALCARFEASRPTVTKALEKLEAAGWLSEGGQGRLRTAGPAESRGAFVTLTGLTEWAYPLAESLLSEPLPRRWKHSPSTTTRWSGTAWPFGSTSFPAWGPTVSTG